jgi:alkylhydroperoxidase/carboxymuconolactone decarboxylase family protein YurZ
MNPIELFKKESPEVFEAFGGLIQSLISMKALDQKTKQLIYIGMKAVSNDTTAVKFHVLMAKQAGASREEVKETIMMTLSVCGLQAINNCLQMVMEIYDNN